MYTKTSYRHLISEDWSAQEKVSSVCCRSEFVLKSKFRVIECCSNCSTLTWKCLYLELISFDSSLVVTWIWLYCVCELESLCARAEGDGQRAQVRGDDGQAVRVHVPLRRVRGVANGAEAGLQAAHQQAVHARRQSARGHCGRQPVQQVPAPLQATCEPHALPVPREWPAPRAARVGARALPAAARVGRLGPPDGRVLRRYCSRFALIDVHQRSLFIVCSLVFNADAVCSCRHTGGHGRVQPARLAEPGHVEVDVPAVAPRHSGGPRAAQALSARARLRGGARVHPAPRARAAHVPRAARQPRRRTQKDRLALARAAAAAAAQDA